MSDKKARLLIPGLPGCCGAQQRMAEQLFCPDVRPAALCMWHGWDRVEHHGALGAPANSGAGGAMWIRWWPNPSVERVQPPGSRAANVRSVPTTAGLRSWLGGELRAHYVRHVFAAPYSAGTPVA